jgi:shikimate kinase
VVLVGLMGVGKSTIGRRLAHRLGWGFVDSDEEIARAMGGLPPGETFTRYGEAAFRDGERRLVARLLDSPRQVIATGGGAFVDPDTRALLNARTVTVWLDAPVAVLAERTRRRNTRPLLAGRDHATVLGQLAAARAHAYREARLHVASDRNHPAAVVDRILAALDTLDARDRATGAE